MMPCKQPHTIVDELEAFFSRFLALNSGLALVLALWSITTHLHERFDAFPYLAITSPTKRCGKTRLCELLGLVCLHPLQTVNISPAALYRLLEKAKHTLLIDEAEYLGRKRDERGSVLREILNAGYRKGQRVYRCKKSTVRKDSNGVTQDGYEVESFETYCPKALVLIGRLQDTLADRCIEIRMERRAQAEIQRFRYARVQAETAPLKKAVEEWANTYAPLVEAHYINNDLRFLHDREAELWQPLFSVATVAAVHRLTELQVSASRMAGAKSDSEAGDYSIQLLKDISDAFTQNDGDKLPTSVLLQTLNAFDESPWAGWSDGKGLDSHALARLLKPFRVRSRSLRCGEQVVKGYLRESFADAWERYL